MERLTWHNGEYWTQVQTQTVGTTKVGYKAICAKLAAYEDTGLEPEAVNAIKLASMGKAIAEITEFDGIPIDRLRGLAKAEQKRQEGCDYCTLLYEISGEDYDVPLEADMRIDNNFCPMCGRDLRGESHDGD